MRLEPDKLNYVAAPDDSIEEAWSKIEVNRHRSVIIVESDKVVGTLSDGDIRKALLAKRLMTTPVREIMNINFIYVRDLQKDTGYAILTSRDLFLLPIVDEEMNIIDVIAR